jgi:hypothetical protein
MVACVRWCGLTSIETRSLLASPIEQREPTCLQKTQSVRILRVDQICLRAPAYTTVRSHGTERTVREGRCNSFIIYIRRCSYLTSSDFQRLYRWDLETPSIPIRAGHGRPSCCCCESYCTGTSAPPLPTRELALAPCKPPCSRQQHAFSLARSIISAKSARARSRTRGSAVAGDGEPFYGRGAGWLGPRRKLRRARWSRGR